MEGNDAGQNNGKGNNKGEESWFTPRRAKAVNIRGTGTGKERGGSKENTEDKKRKGISPTDDEDKRKKRVNEEVTYNKYEEDDTDGSLSDGEDSEKEGDKTAIEKIEEIESETEMELMSMTDIKKLLGNVMKDYREQKKKLEEERKELKKAKKEELKEAVKELKGHIDKRHKKLEDKLEEEIGKVDGRMDEMEERIKKIEQENRSRREADEIRGKNICELLEWKDETEKKREEEKGKEEKAKSDRKDSDDERDRWNRKEMEWMIEQKERDKRRLNLIITGLKANKTYEKEEIEKWILDNIETRVKINKIWRIKSNERTLKLGVQCNSEKEKGEVLRNKRRLGEQKIFIEEDTTWKERRNREIVRAKAREIRGLGKEAIVIKNRKVKTEEGTWVWSEKKEKWFLNEEAKLQKDRDEEKKGERETGKKGK